MKAKREMEEAETRRYIEVEKARKKELEMDKRRMLEQLARDKEERFGKKFDPVTLQEAKKKYTPIEDIGYYIKGIKTTYPTYTGDTFKNCVNTIKVILNNILKNPNEEKFRKCKATNPNFEERVGKIMLAMRILKTLNFEPEGEFLVCKNPDFDLFGKVVALIEEELSKLA
jgi:hypothetical protein